MEGLRLKVENIEETFELLKYCFKRIYILFKIIQL